MKKNVKSKVTKPYDPMKWIEAKRKRKARSEARRLEEDVNQQQLLAYITR